MSFKQTVERHGSVAPSHREWNLKIAIRNARSFDLFRRTRIRRYTVPLKSDELNRVVSERLSHFTAILGVNAPTNYADLNSFVDREVQFWSEKAPNVETTFLFHSLKKGLEAMVRADPEYQARRELDTELNRIGMKQAVLSTAAEAGLLATLYSRDAAAAIAAEAYLQGGVPRAFDRPTFDGFVAGSLFRHPEFVSTNLQALLEQYENHLKEFERSRALLEQALAAQLARAADWLTDSRSVFESWMHTNQEEQKRLREQEITSYKALCEQGESLFTRFESDSLEKYNQLEGSFDQLRAAYNEQLKLSEPARYWHDLEREYDRRGWLCMGMVAVAAAALAWAVSNIVYRPPALFNEATATFGGVKGAILVGVAISVWIYVTTSVMKVALSSFHLARDARERRQLTHVYLALIKESTLDAKEDRSIILSALFSRADTGLLKGDASPSFPTPISIITDALKPGGK
jgi:hypothetical protein